METQLEQSSLLHNCCQDQSNLIVETHKDDLLVKQCVVCKRHHYELTVDPGKLGIKIC